VLLTHLDFGWGTLTKYAGSWRLQILTFRFFTHAKGPEEYSEKEAHTRFEAALRGALKTPAKPLEDKPKVKRSAKRKKRP
jgi:hypothetical protein